MRSNKGWPNLVPQSAELEVRVRDGDGAVDHELYLARHERRLRHAHSLATVFTLAALATPGR